MKKILIAILLNFVFCATAQAESYYFKSCKLTDVLAADYLINFDKNTITVNLEAADGTFQQFTDEIEQVKKNRIVSKKIKSGKSEDFFFVYYLDVDSKSVLKQNYKKESDGLGIFRPAGPKKQSYCSDIKADWSMEDIEVAETNKEQKQISRIQEEMLKKKSSDLECKGTNHNQWNNCFGKFSDKNGFIYIGKFVNGKILDGTALYPGGAKYTGTFENNQPHGQGTFIFSDGSKYYGDWKNGKSDGNGIKVWRNGRKYSGTFKNDQFNGKGTFVYTDGSKYVGEWKNGKRHGKGTLTYADGRAYIGEFIDGQEHGDGTCFAKDGSKISCKKDISSSGRNTKNVSINAEKWIKVSEFESTSGKAKKIIDKLESDFKQKTQELCSLSGIHKILKKKIQILEINETPAIGTEAVIKIGIDGVVECK